MPGSHYQGTQFQSTIELRSKTFLSTSYASGGTRLFCIYQVGFESSRRAEQMARSKKNKEEDKKARRVARGKKGPLRKRKVQESTYKRYRAAVKALFKGLEDQGIKVLNSVHEFESIISDNIESLWEKGDPRSFAENLLSGLHFEVPSLRGQQRDCWDLVAVWQREEPPRRATPFEARLAMALVGLGVASR